MPCDYPGCRATKCLQTTLHRPRQHPRLCPQHMRQLSEDLQFTPERRMEGAVKQWWVRHCRPKKGVAL